MNRILKLFIFGLSILLAMPISVVADDKLPHVYSINRVGDNGIKVVKYGFMGSNEIRVTDAVYDRVYPFSPNGTALVYYNGRYGFIDTKGNYLVPLGLAEARPFDGYGLAAVRQKTKWGLINSKTEFVLKQIFDKIEEFQYNGLAIVKYEGKYGLADTLGNIVLPVIYDKIENFDKTGYAFIKSDNKIGIVDKRGRAIVAPEYKDKKKAMAALSEVKPRFIKPSDNLFADNSNKSASVEDISDKTRKEEEQKQLAEQARKEEEQKQLAEQVRKEEEQRQLAEQARKEEEQRLLAEQTRKEEEQKQLAEQARKEEEQRLLAEQARKEEEQRLLAEQARKAIEQKQAEARKRLEEIPTLKNYITANLGEWNDYLAAKELKLPTEQEMQKIIESEVAIWQVKGEFEPTAKWKERVNETTRAAKINAIADSIFAASSKSVDAVRAEYRKEYEALVDKYCAGIASQFASQTLELKPYDADNETFLISTNDFGDFLLPVPLDEAPEFKKEWDQWKTTATASFVPNGEDVALKTVKIGKYLYDSDMDATYAQVDVEYNFKPVDVSQINRHLDEENDLAFNTDSGATARNKGVTVGKVKVSAGSAPDTDVNIPEGESSNIPTFAVVIANGEYAHASKVNHAENDGRIMTQYLTRTLGIPERNIATFINATYGQMASAISSLQDIGDAYNGSDFNIMFYYVGHGLPDDDGKKSYILPVDIDPRHVSICMPLEKIYADLGNLGANNVTIMIDACFSGSNHGDGMLVPQSMGVAIKSKKAAPVGNMVVLTAAEGNETAFPYEEKEHGLFTYWLLKKLQETSGRVTLGELSDYVIDNVKKTSVTVNRKPQTPTVAISPQLTEIWRTIQFGK